MKLQKIPTFLSYAHTDEAYKDAFLQHLTGLKKAKLELWQDRQLISGEEWDTTIKTQLEKSQLILFLVSPAFMSSTYIAEVELAASMQRKQQKGGVEILPIMLRPTDIENSVLEKFQFLPKNAKPVTTWDNEDTAWLDVVKGIKKVLPKLESYQLPAPQEQVATNTKIIKQVLNQLESTDPVFKEWKKQHQMVNRHIQALATVEEKCHAWLEEYQQSMQAYALSNLDSMTLELAGVEMEDFRRLTKSTLSYLSVCLKFKRSLNFQALLDFLEENDISVADDYGDIYQSIFQHCQSFVTQAEKEHTIVAPYSSFLKLVLERLGQHFHAI